MVEVLLLAISLGLSVLLYKQVDDKMNEIFK